jgi:hypothetical protein
MLSNIRLPRVGDKAVVADGLTVGLRITLADRKLMLDDDPAGQPIA